MAAAVLAMRVTVLAASIITVGLGASIAPTGRAPDLRGLGLGIDAAVTGDYRQGVEFGVTEAKQTAGLMGHDVALVERAGPPLVGLVVLRATPDPAGVPVIQLASTARGRCLFSVAPDDGAGVAWHWSLSRYGASEVNERYATRYRTRMTPEAWLGWFAVKALVDNALRADGGGELCASMAKMRFDGHKGRPLTFDPTSGVLRQPLYIVEGDRVVKEVHR